MKKFNEFKDEIVNGSLGKEYNELLGNLNDLKPEERVGRIVDFAKEKGFDVSTEDFALMEADRQKLDDQELNRMSAGGLTGTIEGREPCWFDYVCQDAWNTCTFSDECFNGDYCEGNILCSVNNENYH